MSILGAILIFCVFIDMITVLPKALGIKKIKEKFLN